MTTTNNPNRVVTETMRVGMDIHKTFGPYDSGSEEIESVSVPTLEDTSATTDMALVLPFLHDRAFYVDVAFLSYTTDPTTACNVRLLKVNADQSVRAALVAGQWLTGTINLGDTAANEDSKRDFSITLPNKIEAGGRIVAYFDDDPAGLEDLLITVIGRDYT